MLSQKIIRLNRIYSICEKSKEITMGDTFTNVRFADSDNYIIHGETSIVCCGNISEDEMLFRSEDGRYYFSVCYGWGEEDGVLYGIERGMFFDFGHPTSDETILAECEKALGEYHSWAGAIAYQSKKLTLENIVGVMRRTVKNEGGDAI